MSTIGRKAAIAALMGVLAACAVPALSAPEWAEDTVWPARAPITLTLDLTKAEVVKWMSEEQEAPENTITDEAMLSFLATAAHAAGSQVGDVEEALARREAVAADGDGLQVTLVAASAVTVVEAQDVLRESQLFQRATQIAATVDPTASKGALTVLRGSSRHGPVLRGRPGDLDTVFASVIHLAVEDPGVLLPPSPALEAWAAGPGGGEAVERLAATRAIGVYYDRGSRSYAAWNADSGAWESVALFTGMVTEGDRPVGAATAVVKLSADSPVKEPAGRIDSVATGPDGSFMLAIAGAALDEIVAGGNKPEFEIAVRKWGYTRAQQVVTPADSPVVDCGTVALEAAATGPAKVPEPQELLLDLPEGYRALAETTADDAGYQRFLRVQYAGVPGSNRLYTSSTEITYSFERVDPEGDNAAWVQSTLNPRTAEWMRRTLATRSIDSSVVDSSDAGGRTIVDESGQWPLLDGTRVHHSSQTHIIALLTNDYRVRLQVLAVGSGNSEATRDPAGVVAGSEALATNLAAAVVDKLTAPPPTEPLTTTANWPAVERMNRVFRGVSALETASVRMEDKAYHPVQDRMPIVQQVIRIEDNPATFALGSGVEVTAEPASRLRITDDGRLKLLGGTFTIVTPEPDGATDDHLRQLGRLITPEGEGEDLVRAVDRAVKLGQISPAYGEELKNLGRDSILRSVFLTCQGLAPADINMIVAPVPVLCFGESQLLLEPGRVVTLNCRTGTAFLGEGTFSGLVRLSGGEGSTSNPGEAPTVPAEG